MSFHEIQWYDRNPTVRVDYKAFPNKAPHTATTRWSYEVPKSRIAMVELLSLVNIRGTAADSVGWAQNWVALTKPEESANTILWCILKDNEVNDLAEKQISSTIILTEGCKLEGKTSDSSTGGTVTYYAAYKITEFDAYEFVSPPITRPIPEKVDIQEPQAVSDPVM